MSYTQRLAQDAANDTRNEMVTLITESIERSISHNEIVPIQFHGDCESLLAVLAEIRDEDVEWCEADGVVEVWGCHDVHEDIMLWRIHADCSI